MYLWPLLLAVGDGVQTLNVLVNIVSLALLGLGVYLFPRYLNAKKAEAQLDEKDRTIATHIQYIESVDQRVKQLTEHVETCQRKQEEAQAEAQVWRGRYEEQSRYTAEPALNEVRDTVTELRQAIVTAVTAHGDLVLEEMRQTRSVLDALAKRA